ncbi:YIP1 family protein [Methanocaldococcus sp.]
MNIIFNPDKFFKNFSKKDDLIKPLLIITLFSTLLSINSYIKTSLVLKIFPKIPMLQIMPFISMIFSFIGGFISYLILAALFYIITIFLDGKGSFKKFLALFAYTYIPNIIGLILLIIANYYFLSNVDVQSIINLEQNPEVIIKNLYPKTLIFTEFLINLAVTIWNVVLWAYAIKYGREIEFKKALIIASIFGAISILLSVYGIIKYL